MISGQEVEEIMMLRGSPPAHQLGQSYDASQVRDNQGGNAGGEREVEERRGGGKKEKKRTVNQEPPLLVGL